MDIVTGHVGSAHVTSWQDRDLNQGIFGPDTYILNVGSKLAATIISNNEIRIADGTLVMQGCQGVIQKGTYDTISIDNGTQGLKRNDLICAQYTKSAGVESMSLVVIKGTAASTPVDPSYTSGDIQNGDALVQVPIYRVSLNGLTVTSVEPMVIVVGNLESMSYGLIDGTATIGSRSMVGNAIPLNAGTYERTFCVSASSNIPSLWCCIDIEDYAITSGLGKYDSSLGKQKVGVTAIFTLDTPKTIIFYAGQESGQSVSVDYRISGRKIG